MLRRPVAIGPESRDKERRHHATLTFERTEMSHPRAQGGAHSGTPAAAPEDRVGDMGAFGPSAHALPVTVGHAWRFWPRVTGWPRASG